MMAILQHEVKYYFKNIHEAIYLYGYIISIMILAPFTTSIEQAATRELGVLSLWVALASAVALGSASLFARDRETGRLEYYPLLPITLEAMIIAKWLAFLLFLLMPLLAALPVIALLYNMNVSDLAGLGLAITLGTIALSIIATLSAALMSALPKASAMISLLQLPLSIPVIIFGASFCRNTHDLPYENLLFLIGFSLFMAPLMSLAGAASIRQSY